MSFKRAKAIHAAAINGKFTVSARTLGCAAWAANAV